MRLFLFPVVALLGACATAPAPAQPNADAAWYARDNDVSIAEAERRLARQAEIGAFQERLSPDPHFAGLWIEHRPAYRVVVRFIGEDPAAQLRRYTNDPLYVAAPAEVSYAQLLQTQQDVHVALAREQLYVMGSSVDVKQNRVVFDVVSDDDIRRAAAEGRLTLPAFVELREHGGVIAEAQTLGAVRAFPQARYPAGAEMAALGRGELVVVDGCLRLKGTDNDPGALIVWPSSALLEEESGRIQVRNRITHVVLPVGARIEMGGGFSPAIDPTFLTAPIPESCRGEYWIAGNEWRLAGE